MFDCKSAVSKVSRCLQMLVPRRCVDCILIFFCLVLCTFVKKFSGSFTFCNLFTSCFLFFFVGMVLNLSPIVLFLSFFCTLFSFLWVLDFNWLSFEPRPSVISLSCVSLSYIYIAILFISITHFRNRVVYSSEFSVTSLHLMLTFTVCFLDLVSLFLAKFLVL